MKITLMSDIHLEFWENPNGLILDLLLLTPESDLIVLAGDVAVLAHGEECLTRLLESLSQQGKVLFTPGNHEYYGRAFECGEESLNSIKKNLRDNQNIHVNTGAPEWIKYGDLSFLVGTMWFPNLMYSDAEKSWLSDFKVKNLESHIYRYNEYFENLLEGADKKNIVTVSHHSPTFKSSHPKYAGSSLNRFFCNDWDDLLGNVRLACHGHLHDAVDYKLGKTRVVSNPMGYPTEVKSSWKPLTIEI